MTAEPATPTDDIDPDLRDLCQMARSLARVRYALIFLADGTQCWTEPGLRIGDDASAFPHQLFGSEFTVEDNRLDPRFSQHPLTVGPPHFRSFTNIPLHDERPGSEPGTLLGVLNLFDIVPRPLLPEERAALVPFCALLRRHLQGRRHLPPHPDTEVKRLRDALHKSEALQKRIAQATAEGIWRLDRNTHTAYVNPRMAEMLGYTPEEMLAVPHHAFLFPEDVEKTRACLGRSFAGETFRTRCAFRRKDGSRLIVDLASIPLLDEDGTSQGSLGLCTDVTERLRVERDHARLISVLEATPDYVSIVRSDGETLYLNPAGRQALGVGPDEDPGPFTSRYDQETLASDRRDGWPLLARGGSYRSEASFLRRDGREVAVSRVSVGRRDPDGSLYVATVARDIGDLKQVEARLREQAVELAEARDAALHASRLKSQFLANMSHEIRTPLNGVLGMLGILLDSELTADQRDCAETAVSSAEALLHILNDILDLSKIEAGKTELLDQPIDLVTLVEEVVAGLSGPAESKGLDLGCVVQERRPPKLRGDGGRLRQVLSNLVGNAVKFTEKGGVSLRARVEETTAERVKLRFEVEDTGIGISREAQGRLFQPFVQADGSTSRRYGGTGLGLAISRQIAVLMEGETGVRSEPGAGSTFWFSAWLKRAAEGDVAGDGGEASFVGLRTLSVDPHEHGGACLMTENLRLLGVDATSVRGLAAAEALLSGAPPDAPYHLVFVELRPGLAVPPLLERLRRAGGAACRLVTISPLGRRPAEAGPGLWLSRPLRRAQLPACLRDGVAPARAEAAPGAEGRRQKERERTQWRVLVVEDNPVNQKVARRMLERLGLQVETANDGREAVAAHRRAPYDALFMDAQMPEMDGYQATAAIRLREREGGGRVPIIAMTANAMSGDRERCLSAGMDDYLTKPLDLDALRAVVGRLLGGAPTRPPAPRGARSAPVPPGR